LGSPGDLRALAEAAGSAWCFDYDACPAAPGLLVSIDGYGMRESRLPWMSLEDWGWKAVVAAASDVAASGGQPLVVFYSVGVGGFSEALEVARGVSAAAGWMGAVVGKSDVNRGVEGWIDVAVVGGSSGAVPRSGASPGDLVLQAGYVGVGAVVERVLRGELSVDAVPRSVLEASRRPRPPVALGRYLPRCGASAASDNSDGWGYTLSLVAEASHVSIVLERVLVDPAAAGALGSLGLDPEEASLDSWEDYSLAITAPEGAAECLLEACKRLSIPCDVVGRVESGRGVEFRGRRLEPRYWRSL